MNREPLPERPFLSLEPRWDCGSGGGAAQIRLNWNAEGAPA